MLTQEAIRDNLRFLILEVDKQLHKTQRYFKNPDPKLLEKIHVRDNYVNSLRNTIQRKCFTLAAEPNVNLDTSVETLWAVNVITANLEHIADYCVSMIGQYGHLRDMDLLKEQDFTPAFEHSIAGVRMTESGVMNRDVKVALKICAEEFELDKLYARSFKHLLAKMQEPDNDVPTLVTLLFISHYFERIGDALLNIGEAIISAALGEKMKIDQYQALRGNLSDTHEDAPIAIDQARLLPLSKTRSGNQINRVLSQRAQEEGTSVIFKEGQAAKLTEEKTNIERWHKLVPGLAPAIHSFYEQGDKSSILFEYIPGNTFESVLLRGRASEVRKSLTAICQTVKHVWTITKTDRPAKGGYCEQLQSRLSDVYSVHPQFRGVDQKINRLTVPSFDSLVDAAAKLEKKIPAPFSVFIHGDFNVDNIIFDADDGTTRFIDLGRSRRTDYVQDVSVFLVSNLRLPVVETEVRKRINVVTTTFFEFATQTAAEMNDPTFQARLALALARSFMTSTRFMLDRAIAHWMYQRARYLLERVLDHDPKDLESFRLPREVIID
ncbi:phosphotransferase [bacterium]|nr:phosphotransferase [bacterium]MCB9476183.1 phosphotransferase [Deltaproteobacteria bacterium]